MKTYSNTDAKGAKENVSDLEIWGNGDLFKLLSKASSKKENWMKSTKAMQIHGIGCVVQTTTQQGDHVSDSSTFVPGVMIDELIGEDGKVISRILVAFG